MAAFRKLCRSISLPETCDADVTESQSKTAWWKLTAQRISRSLTRVDDRSNSAAPLRRQPHPFAMHAFGMRVNLGGRGTRLPEWPPPDPPPLTPLTLGTTRTNTELLTPWPTRPWWRRTGTPRPNSPIVHVTIDTSDTLNPIPVRLAERPTRIGWANSSDENDHEPREVTTGETATNAPQQSSLANTENENSSVVATATRTIHSADNQRAWAQIGIHTASFEDATELPSNNLPSNEERGAATAMATEDVGMISLNSEEIHDESTFQVFVVVLDSNPTIHSEYNTREPGFGLLPRTLELIRQHYGAQYDVSQEEAFGDEDESNDHR